MTLQFHRPPDSDATEPPEVHGVARDAVKLLVARPGGVSHARFADLGAYLRPGDLLVVNNSATLPAAVDGHRAGRPVAIHFSAARAEKVWVVELRPAANATGPMHRHPARRTHRHGRRQRHRDRVVLPATRR